MKKQDVHGDEDINIEIFGVEDCLNSDINIKAKNLNVEKVQTTLESMTSTNSLFSNYLYQEYLLKDLFTLSMFV